MSSISILNSLADDDTLRSALIWTGASDHEHLRQTCSRFRDICDSQMFLQQRCEEGLAEVEVPMSLRYTGEVPEHLQLQNDENESNSDSNSNSESDDEPKRNEFGFFDYGVVHSDAKIYVDKKEAGLIKMQFVPFNHEDGFHAVSDAVSNELTVLATTFFSSKGRPNRVPSVQDAFTESISSRHWATTYPFNYFLYISKFQLKKLYQCNKSGSTIGAKALKNLLTNDVLVDKWELAMYIPECTYSSSMELEGEARLSSIHSDMIADMRKFLQAGFEQVKETVNITDCLQVFCTPLFLEKKDILTEDEASAIPVKMKVEPSKQQSEEAKQLLAFFVEKCSSRRDHMEKIRHFEQMTCSDHPTLKEPLAEARQLQDEANDGAFEQARELLPLLEQSYEQLLAQEAETRTPGDECELLERIELCRGVLETQETSRNKVMEMIAEIEEMFRTYIQEVISDIKSQILNLNVEIKDRLSQLLAEHIGTRNFSKIVTESFAFHSCSFNLEPEFIEILIGCVPKSERMAALNLADSVGCTPLMLAVKAECSDSEHKRNMQLRTCQMLLNYGADRDIQDLDGRTALGVFRYSMRDIKDFLKIRDLDVRHDAIHVREMESLLMPSSGTTRADKYSM